MSTTSAIVPCTGIGENTVGVPLRVLIVEDSENDVLLLVRELKRGGYDVTYQRVDSAPSLNAVLGSREWDLIVTDYSMPNFNGIAALKMVREKGLDVPFIFLSGTIGEDTAVTAMKLGAHDYIMKGNLTRLLPAIQRELQEVEVRRENKRFEQQIRQLQKFEAIGKLAGGIAHDFNNVLGAIMGWAEYGERKTKSDPDTKDLFQKIRDQAQRAAGLTRQLLAFARRQILEPRNVDLNQTVKETVTMLQKVIGANIEIKMALASNLELTRADPSQLDQVLMNLCLNARDAMPDGGFVLIETSNSEFDEEHCRRHLYARPGRYVQLSVTDNGAGMDAATVEQIFEPFFTTKAIGQGTGLGLATSYGIVKQHGGFIDVESEPGRGTTFRVFLPVGQGVEDARTPTVQEDVRGGSETILIAEDHEGLREMARLMLEGLGYEVLLAGDGEEAVHLYQTHRDRISLVLLDLVMPKIAGTEVCLQMFNLNPRLPVVFTTGYSAEAPLLGSLEDKGVAILQKPYTVKVLAQTIREVLDRQ